MFPQKERRSLNLSHKFTFSQMMGMSKAGEVRADGRALLKLNGGPRPVLADPAPDVA